MADRTNIKGVINIGSHRGEQYNEWLQAGARNFLLIEPIASNFAELEKKFKSVPNVKLVKTALGSFTGKISMYNDPGHLSFSASTLKPTGHYEDYPDIKFDKTEEVDITTLDSLDYDRELYDHIYITAQGMELEILKNGTESLKFIQTIKSQVYNKQLFEGSFITDEMNTYLSEIGFDLKEVQMRGKSWDYATYKRR